MGKSVGAGFMIGLGGMAYLTVENRILGAALFAVGLYSVLVFDLDLFTGKACYFDGDNVTVLGLVSIWLGNAAGAVLAAFLAVVAGLAGAIERSQEICAGKVDRSLIGLFMLGLLCNVMIYVAVVGHRRAEGAGKWMAILFGVMVFVLCGFEHCVADMFYFALYATRDNLWEVSGRLIVVTAGNLAGAFVGTQMLGGIEANNTQMR